MPERWTRESWRRKPIVQVPDYPDQPAAAQVERQLASFPPLIFAGEARELKKAGSDLTDSFKLDHEPEHKPYDYGYPPYDEQSASYGEPAAIEAKPDLTDYTIAGQPVKEPVGHNGSTSSGDDHSAYAVAHTDSADSSKEPIGHAKEG